MTKNLIILKVKWHLCQSIWNQKLIFAEIVFYKVTDRKCYTKMVQPEVDLHHDENKKRKKFHGI